MGYLDEVKVRVLVVGLGCIRKIGDEFGGNKMRERLKGLSLVFLCLGWLWFW